MFSWCSLMLVFGEGLGNCPSMGSSCNAATIYG